MHIVNVLELACNIELVVREIVAIAFHLCWLEDHATMTKHQSANNHIRKAKTHRHAHILAGLAPRRYDQNKINKAALSTQLQRRMLLVSLVMGSLAANGMYLTL